MDKAEQKEKVCEISHVFVGMGNRRRELKAETEEKYFLWDHQQSRAKSERDRERVRDTERERVKDTERDRDRERQRESQRHREPMIDRDRGSRKHRESQR